MLNIIIDSRDLNFTIDTYGTFTGDNAGESMTEFAVEEYGLDINAVNIDYDMPTIRRELAEASVSILQEYFIDNGRYQDADGIVKSITLIGDTSPKYYNYTTDSYTADWLIDEDKLKAIILANWDAYKRFVENEWLTVNSNINWHDKTWLKYNYTLEDYDTSDMFEEEEVTVSMLDFWTRKQLDDDDYLNSMYESEFEIYYENMKYDDDTEALITDYRSK